MAMTYSIDKARGLVYIVGSGALTDADMFECIAKLRRDPSLEPDMNTLSDMRGIEVAFTSQGIEAMLQVMDATANERGDVRAAVVVDTDLAFGMGRMLELKAGERADPTFRIFKDIDAASLWLGS